MNWQEFITTIFTLLCCLRAIQTTACPSGWKVFQEHCYKFASESRNWTDARVQCKRAGADLVKISSTAENYFVIQNKKGTRAWLGLQRGFNHTFRWVDGTPLVFTAWYPTEPNDKGGEEDCGHMYPDGTWNDNQCKWLYGYVCEKDVDECSLNNGNCSHQCINTDGGYQCACPDPELQLSQDNRTCIAFGVKITCSQDQMEIYIPKSILANLHRRDLTLNNVSCGSKENSTHFLLVTSLIDCGTVAKETRDKIVYTNRVIERAITKGSIITRVRPVEITFSCSYLKRKLVSAIGLKPNYRKRKFSEDENGTFSANLDIFPNSNFTTPYKKFPVSVKLRKLLYIQASIMFVDKQLSLKPDRCFATPERNAASKPVHVLIINSCPADRTVKFLRSPSHNLSRFSVEAFKFVGSKPLVFIHCEIVVCNASDVTSACTKQCQSGVRSKRHDTGNEIHTVTGGPLIFDGKAGATFDRYLNKKKVSRTVHDEETDNYKSIMGHA